MSKKKKKKEPVASASAEVVADRDDHEEQDALDDTEGLPTVPAVPSSNVAETHAAEAHGDGGHGHGGHDPVEDDRPRNGLIAVLTVASCITVIVFCVFVRELFNAWGNEELYKKVLSVQSEQLKDLRAGEKRKLSKYQWVSQKDGVLRIPADRAIDLTIAAYRSPPPAPVPTMVAPPPPKPEDIKPEDKPDDKKGDDGKKDEKKGDEKGKKKGDGK